MTAFMTPRERWEAVMAGEKPDRVPMDYWATEEVNQKLMKYLQCDQMDEVFAELNIDKPAAVAPAYGGPSLPENHDMYGCKYRDVEYETGVYRECVYHPLEEYDTVSEIKENYTWPTTDWFDYDVIPDQIKGKEDFPVRGGGSEPFLIYKNLRGQEQAFMDLVLKPEMVHYCLDQLFDFCYENTERIYSQIPDRILFSYVAEDMGGEENLLYSPDQIREFLLPRMKRMIDLAHDAGAYAFHHNDGAVRKIIPDLIDIGIDILNPIQWNTPGMERQELKDEFGDKLVFHGAVDNQYTLAFGSEEEIEQEVEDNINILGENGGYILAPCHNIQAVSPPENVVTMYKAGYKLGAY